MAARPYQVDAQTAVEAAWGDGEHQRVLLEMATGVGKSVIIAHVVRARKGRALVIAHRDELLDQVIDKIRRVNPNVSMGKVGGGSREIEARVVVASVQSLHPKRLATVLARGAFKTVIVDEAHHAGAPTYVRLLEGVGAFDVDGPRVLGVTATAIPDNKRFSAVWQHCAYEYGLLAAIRDGYLSDVRARYVSARFDVSGVRSVAGEFVQADLARELEKQQAPAIAAEAYIEHARERRGLVFTPTVELAMETAEQLRQRGIKAEGTSGQLNTKDRRALLARFKSGETQVVCNAQLYTEGFDEPSASCIMVAAPTMSRVRYMQMIGRGTRKWPGKDYCLILDLVGASGINDVQRLGPALGLPGDLSAGTMTAAAHNPAANPDGGGSGQAMDFTGVLEWMDVDITGGAGQAFHWVTFDGGFALDLGQQAGLVLMVSRADGTQALGVILDRHGNERRRLGVDLDIEQALQLGEDYARAQNVDKLAGKDVRWRARPASAGQRRFATKLGIAAPRGANMGMMSDLITARRAEAILAQNRR